MLKEKDEIMENETPNQLPKMSMAGYENAWFYIQSLDYSDKDKILYLEQQLYNLLQQNPEDCNLLALLMHEQIMNNRGQRARSIAYKIWDLGGEIAPEIEKMYIDDLINLGLSDMAGTALSWYIGEIENSVRSYGDILVKYAVFVGNMSLLERILAYMPDDKRHNTLRDWIELNEEVHASNHIAPVMRRILENVSDAMLGFSFNVYTDRDVPDIEFVFYVDDSITNYTELKETIYIQISTYCAAHKIVDLRNLNVAFYPLIKHPRQDLWLAPL